MNRKFRTYTLVGLVVIFFSAWFFTPIGTILSYRIAPSYPSNKSQTLKIENLNSGADVYFDDYGIPHIEADNIEDLMFAVGFVQGRYRYFQIDMMRKFAGGRLSELLGEQKLGRSSTVDIDLAMRGWAFYERTKFEMSSLPELDQKIIKAFTDGMNIALDKYTPVEYQILGITPEKFQPQDIFVASMLQAWSISHNWENEAVRLGIALTTGSELSEQLFPAKSFGTPTIKPNDKEYDLPPSIVEEVKVFLPEKPLPTQEIHKNLPTFSSVMGDLISIRPSASNAWAVNQSMSQSGKSILSNDMHLSHRLPSLMYLQHYKMPGLDIIGSTMPGLPTIVAGHNGSVAWGVTAAQGDAMDLYLEKIDPSDPSLVLNEGEPCPLVDKPQKIKIRDGNKFIEKEFRLRKTCRGTVFNDMYPNFLPSNAPLVSLKWNTPRVTESIGHLFKVNQAKNVDELRNAFMAITSPIINITTADSDNNIAFFSTGTFPVRKFHRGTFPSPGWIQKYQWNDWASVEEMPFVKNPSENLVINTNNLARDPKGYKKLFQVDSAPSYRKDRVEELLVKNKPHSIKSMNELQKDTKLLRGKLIAPYIISDLKTKKLKSIEAEAFEALKSWDFETKENSVAMSLFIYTYYHIAIEVLRDKLHPNAFDAFLNLRYSSVAIDSWFTSKNKSLWDNPSTKEKESRQDVVYKAFISSVSKLRKKFGNKIKEWRWGKLHLHHPKHPFGSKNILSFFNLDKTELAGSMSSVWKAHFNFGNNKEPFKVLGGPVFRQVISFSDLENSMYAIDTGMSGWPLSPHYGDQYQNWKTGTLVKMYYNWDEIRSKFSKTHLSLRR